MQDKLHDAISANNYIAVAQMIETGELDLSSDIRGAGLVTPLILAAMWGSVNCLNVIIQKIPQEKINDVESNKKTALMYAAENGYTECVKLLIDYRADLFATDDDGKTAYDLAAGRECCSKQYSFMPTFTPVMEGVKLLLETIFNEQWTQEAVGRVYFDNDVDG